MNIIDDPKIWLDEASVSFFEVRLKSKSQILLDQYVQFL